MAIVEDYGNLHVVSLCKEKSDSFGIYQEFS